MPPIIDDFLERTENIWRPVVDYLKAGTTIGAILFMIMTSLFSLRLFTNFIPTVIDAIRPPVMITGDMDEVDFRPDQRYRIQADAITLLETQSGDPLQIGNQYWGVYELDNYSIYVTSHNPNTLNNPSPSAVTGRIAIVGNQVSSLNDATNRPGVVMPFVYQPYNPLGGIIGALIGLLISGFFVAITWYFYHLSVIRMGGYVPFPQMNELHAKMRPLGEKIQQLQLWIAQKLMSQMGGSIGNIVQQTDSRSRPPNNDGGHPTITIDPDKVRKKD